MLVALTTFSLFLFPFFPPSMTRKSAAHFPAAAFASSPRFMLPMGISASLFNQYHSVLELMKLMRISYFRSATYHLTLGNLLRENMLCPFVGGDLSTDLRQADPT